jgi:hypothetical protein
MTDEKNDHDLVIRIDTKVDMLTKKVDDLVSGTTARIDTLEKTKAEKQFVEQLQNKINNDIEIRVRRMEEAVVDPIEHKKLLESTSINNVYLKWIVALIVILIGIMSAHILNIRFP